MLQKLRSGPLLNQGAVPMPPGGTSGTSTKYWAETKFGIGTSAPYVVYCRKTYGRVGVGKGAEIGTEIRVVVG